MSKSSIINNHTKKGLSSNDKILKINEKIRVKLEQGLIPWRKNWEERGQQTLASNGITKKPYKGINSTLLNMELRPNQNPYFFTFKQVKDLGGKIKKGEKGEVVIFWKIHSFAVKGKSGKGEEASMKTFPLLRYSYVFNLEQIELPEEQQAKFVVDTSSLEEEVKEERITNFLDKIKDKPVISFRGDRASYNASKDIIKMPLKNQFENEDSFYSTLFHELGHSTGHPKRLNREGIAKPASFGTPRYAKEELIAEMTCNYIASHCKTKIDYDNTTAYIQNWSQLIQDDPYFFVTACSKAQKAFDYLTNQVSSEEG
ncbi:hypothetical protein NIES267_73550 (plasmid) [Calothrix parasitica NIES-267]|uniref:Antirestriction protein n=1 Tax=Calothrix parasitica NIES-267 TaxID=1973488 RepID=A0A1Z4M361_9CYAN|nr:hypothetical protein NIES267_73550 [Calothrix parasitica NIES-267]